MQKRKTNQRIFGIRLMALALLMSVFTGVKAQEESEYQRKKISLQIVNESVEQALEKVGKAADVRFFYNHSAFDFTKKINVNVKDRELRDVIGEVLAGYSVDVEYQLNHTIVLRQRKTVDAAKIQKVNGVVKDANTGEVLIGASVVLKEQKGVGVVTNVDGKFHLEMLIGSATALEISYVGYEKETVTLTNEDMDNLVVKLSPMTKQIDEVVVTGMAPRKVDGFTGRYVSVKGEELKRLNPNNLLQALQLFDPSFHIVENNAAGSDPNALPDFRLRGDVQLGASDANKYQMMMGDYSNRPNMPLFILDGFEATLQRIIDLDPERVESITILKDAAGTAMYGSKASNGVIIFETKKPKPGALTLSYSGNVGIDIPDLSDYNLMDASEKLEYERMAGMFNTPSMLNYYNKYKAEILRGVNTYWLSQPLRTAVTHRHTLSVEGGDEVIRYGLNINYGDEFGVMKGSDRNNMGLSLSLSYRRKKWNISNTLEMSNTLAKNSPYGEFHNYTRLNPYYRMTDENGKYIKLLDRKPMGQGNPAQEILNPLYNTQFPSVDENNNFTVVDNFSLEYAIMENLRISGQVSFRKGMSRMEKFVSANNTAFQGWDLTRAGSYEKNTGESVGWSANAAINYNLVKDKHGLYAGLRWNVDASHNNAVGMFAYGFPDDNMTDFNFAFKMERDPQGTESTSRSVGVLATLNYMYDNRYSVDLSLRGDLSSQFGSGAGMAPFWSVGLRYNMHREKWFEGTAVSNFALYASMGVTGSQSFAPYQARETYSFDQLMFHYPSGDVLGAQLMGIGNPELGWSQTWAKSVSGEFGFWNSRLNATISYYHNLTDEMLLETNVQPSTGFPTLTRNVGSVLNEGIDVGVNGLIISDYNRGIQWSLGINATHNRNVIKEISNSLRKMNEWENYDPTTGEGEKPTEFKQYYEEGESTTVLKEVCSLGIDPATGKELFLKANGEKTFKWDPADKVVVGDTEPKLRGSLNSSFMWKNFSVALGFSFEFGADVYNQTLVDKIENTPIGYNVDRRAAGPDRWSETNRYAKYKGMSYLNAETPRSTRFLQTKNEFVFNSISVGYRFDPKQFKFLEACKIASMNLNLSTQELGRISSIRQERGINYPFARSYNLSLSVLFN